MNHHHRFQSMIILLIFGIIRCECLLHYKQNNNNNSNKFSSSLLTRNVQRRNVGFVLSRYRQLGQQEQQKRRLFHQRWNSYLYIKNTKNDNHNDDDETKQQMKTKTKNVFCRSSGETNRAQFLKLLCAAAATTTTTTIGTVYPFSSALAMGLVMFPCTQPLANTYHFMRVGQSLLEAEDVWSTNPLFLTNRESALSDIGIRQVEKVCDQMHIQGISPTIVMYSLAASSVDTANIVGRELKIGRDRLVPEFTFIDPRAIGRWDLAPMSLTEPAIWALDVDEAGPSGRGGRPPPNEDGTPNETLGDQVIRLRQLMSAMETQYSGDTILVIFPDGTGPALLSSLIAGIPLNRVHELNYAPAELRLNVTMTTTLDTLSIKNNDNNEDNDDKKTYLATIEKGRKELQILRERGLNVMSVRDESYEEERRLEDAKQEMMEIRRKKQMDDEKKALLEQREKEQIESRNRQRLLEEERQKKRDMVLAQRNNNNNNKDNKDVEGGFSIMRGSGVAAMAVVAATTGLAGLGMNEDDNNNKFKTITNDIQDQVNATTTNDLVIVPASIIANDHKDATPNDDDDDVAVVKDGMISSVKTIPSPSSTTTNSTLMETTTMNEADVMTMVRPTKTSTRKEREELAKNAMKAYLDQDDGAEAWLQSLTDIIVEQNDDGDDDDDKTTTSTTLD